MNTEMKRNFLEILTRIFNKNCIICLQCSVSKTFNSINYFYDLRSSCAHLLIASLKLLYIPIIQWQFLNKKNNFCFIVALDLSYMNFFLFKEKKFHSQCVYFFCFWCIHRLQNLWCHHKHYFILDTLSIICPFDWLIDWLLES